MEEGFDPVPVAVESTDPTTTSRDGAAAAAGPHEQELEAPADGGGGGGRALVATTTTTTTTSDAAASAVPASGGGANPVQLSTDRRIATGTSALSDRPEGPSPLQDRPLYSPLSPTARAAMLFRSFIDAAGTFSDAVPSPIASIVAKQRSEILASALRAAAAAQPKSTSGSPSQPKAKGIAAATAGDERLSSSSSSGRKVETVWDSEDYEALAIVRAMAEQAKELERILAESIEKNVTASDLEENKSFLSTKRSIADLSADAVSVFRIDDYMTDGGSPRSLFSDMSTRRRADSVSVFDYSAYNSSPSPPQNQAALNRKASALTVGHMISDLDLTISEIENAREINDFVEDLYDTTSDASSSRQFESKVALYDNSLATNDAAVHSAEVAYSPPQSQNDGTIWDKRSQSAPSALTRMPESDGATSNFNYRLSLLGLGSSRLLAAPTRPLPEVMQNLPPSNFNNAALQAQRSNGYGPRGEQRSEQFGWSPVSGAMSPSIDTTSSGYTSPLPGKPSPLPHLSAKASVDSNPPRWASLLHGHEPASNANNPSSITANRLASLSRTATPTPSMDDRRTDSYPQHQPPVSYFFPPSSRQELRDSPNIRVQSPTRIKHFPAIELSEASSTNSASIESTEDWLSNLEGNGHYTGSGRLVAQRLDRESSSATPVPQEYAGFSFPAGPSYQAPQDWNQFTDRRRSSQATLTIQSASQGGALESVLRGPTPQQSLPQNNGSEPIAMQRQPNGPGPGSRHALLPQATSPTRLDLKTILSRAPTPSNRTHSAQGFHGQVIDGPRSAPHTITVIPTISYPPGASPEPFVSGDSSIQNASTQGRGRELRSSLETRGNAAVARSKSAGSHYNMSVGSSGSRETPSNATIRGTERFLRAGDLMTSTPLLTRWGMLHYYKKNDMFRKLRKGFYVLSAAKQRLYWFKGVTSSGNIEAGEVSAGSIAVDTASVVQLVKLFIRGEKFGFEIEVEDDFDEEFKEAGKRGKRKWCLVAENEEERNAWVKSIERVIADARNAADVDLRRQASSGRPTSSLAERTDGDEDHRHFEEHSALVRYEQQQQQHQLQQQIQQQRAYQQQMQLHQQQLQHQQRMQSFGPSPPRLSLLGPSTSMGQVVSPTSIGSGFHYPVSATAHTTSTPSLTHRTSSQPGSFGSPTTPTAPMLPFSMQSQIQPTPPSTPTPSLALGSHTPSRFHLQDPLLVSSAETLERLESEIQATRMHQRQLLLAQQALISVAMAKQQWSQPQLQMQQMGIGQGAPYGGGGSFSGLSPATLHASMKPPPPSSSSSGSTNSSGHFYRQSMGVPMGASVSAFSGLPSSMHSSLSSSTLPYYGNRVPGSGAAGVPSMILEGVESLDGGGTATPTPSFQ